MFNSVRVVALAALCLVAVLALASGDVLAEQQQDKGRRDMATRDLTATVVTLPKKHHKHKHGKRVMTAVAE